MKTHFYFQLSLFIALLSPLGAKASCYGNGYLSKFNALTHQITVQYSEHNRQQLANQFFSQNCFTHVQLNQVLNLMRTDAAKYAIATKAYRNMDDTSGFYTAQYLFASNNYKSQFRSFLRAQKRKSIHRDHYHPYRNLHFPNYQYPVARIFPREAASARIFNEGAFLHFASRINRIGSDFAKKQQISNEFSKRSFTTEQFMKLLSLIRSYQIRFELATRLYGLLFDLENAEYLEEVFDRTHFRIEFSTFLQQNSLPGYLYTETPYDNYSNRIPLISAKEMSLILSSLRNESFSSRKVELAKTIISSKLGFTSQQMALIVGEMSFDSHKLDVAKFGYQYVTDRDNYFVVANQLTFGSNKSALLRFIRNNP
ncbi:MAG: DUF4476 domain-containing protein [Bacteroidia bacterium]